MCMSSLHTCALGVKNDAATYDLLMRFFYAIFNKGKKHPFVANKKCIQVRLTKTEMLLCLQQNRIELQNTLRYVRSGPSGHLLLLFFTEFHSCLAQTMFTRTQIATFKNISPMVNAVCYLNLGFWIFISLSLFKELISF